MKSILDKNQRYEQKRNIKQDRTSETYRGNIPSALTSAASFVHPEIPAARWKINVFPNIQAFSPLSRCVWGGTVRIGHSRVLSGANPPGWTQMSFEFPTSPRAPSRLSCCNAHGSRFPWTPEWMLAGFLRYSNFQKLLWLLHFCFPNFGCLSYSVFLLWHFLNIKAHCILSLLAKNKIRRKTSSSPFAPIWSASLHHMYTFSSSDSNALPTVTNPQHLPPARCQWYSPRDKAQDRRAKRNSGKRWGVGVALVGAQSGSPACVLHSS